jgi:beta-phosphoglucomutase
MPATSLPPGIVFDMDGVLLASSPIHEAAYRAALDGLPIREFQYARLAGLRTHDGIRAILAANGIELTEQRIDILAATKSRIALERILAENPVAPGARQVLRALSARHRLALASSASPACVNAFVDRNGMRSLFHCVLHVGDVAQAKPHPEIFQLAFRRLGLTAGNCLVVEDAVVGIQAAKAAGALACGIPSNCPADELERAGADLIIQRLEDLLEIGSLG